MQSFTIFVPNISVMHPVQVGYAPCPGLKIKITPRDFVQDAIGHLEALRGIEAVKERGCAQDPPLQVKASDSQELV